MSWNSHRVALGSRRQSRWSNRRRTPRTSARLTAVALDDRRAPAGVIAFVAADSQFGSPVSELVANARVLNINQGFAVHQDLATTGIGRTVAVTVVSGDLNGRIALPSQDGNGDAKWPKAVATGPIF
jgi:hypothetical protein